MKNVIVTIARQYGSGGKTIGEMFAKKNGIPCHGRDILRIAADDSGINEVLFGEVDEKLKNGSLFGISKKIYSIGDLIPPSSPDFTSAANLFNYQAKAIRDLAEAGPCVFIGRCADFILSDKKNVVSVFIHAPKEYCMEQAKERTSSSVGDLGKYIDKTDKFRGDFYRYHTGHEWNDARNYDLCLDSSKLGFDGCVEAIEQYIAVRFKD